MHRFRFTGESKQLQPREMFEMMRRNMRLDQIHADISDELTTVIAFVDMQEQQHQTQAASRLSIVATLGVIGGLIFSFLGMNVIVEKDMLRRLFGFGSDSFTFHTVVFSGVALAFCSAAFVMMSSIDNSAGRYSFATRKARDIVKKLCIASAILLIFSAMARMLERQREKVPTKDAKFTIRSAGRT